MNNQPIAELLKAYRISQNMYQLELARRIGINQGTLNNIESEVTQSVSEEIKNKIITWMFEEGKR